MWPRSGKRVSKRLTLEWTFICVGVNNTTEEKIIKEFKVEILISKVNEMK